MDLHLFSPGYAVRLSGWPGKVALNSFMATSMASLWSLVTAAKVFRPRRTMIAWFRGTVSPGLAFVITGIGRKELNCLKDWITGGSVAVMHF